MRRLFKKQNGSVGIMLFSIFFLLLIAIILVVFVQQSAITTKTSRINESIETVLSNSVKGFVDYKDYAEGGELSITEHTAKELFMKFKNNTCSTLKLSKSETNEEDYAKTYFIGKAESGDNVLKGDIAVKNFKLYNLTGDNVVTHTVQSDGNVSTVNGIASSTYLPSDISSETNTAISNSCVYVQIEYTIKGYFGAEAKTTKGYLVLLNNSLFDLGDDSNFGNNVPQKGN